MTIPGHVLRHLQTTGVLDENGIGRRARWQTCPRCSAQILTGLDDDLCAGVARVDPTPLNPAEELVALLTKRDTYDLEVTPSLRLDRRDQWRIGSPRRDLVVPAHRCGLPLAPTAHLAKPATRYPDTPPF